jgi:replicative DNA helicase
MPDRISLERTMPNSVESERAVLRAVLLDDRVIFPTAEVLTVEDFYLESHREIFRATLALAEEGTSIDLFTVREELRQRDREEAAGGPAYLASLTDELPRGLNVRHYARTVVTPISGDSDCSTCGGIIPDRYEPQLLPS